MQTFREGFHKTERKQFAKFHDNLLSKLLTRSQQRLWTAESCILVQPPSGVGFQCRHWGDRDRRPIWPTGPPGA